MNKRIYAGITLLCLITLLTGCNTTGLSKREQGVGTYSKLVYGLYEKQEKGASAPVHFPIKLAVAQIGENTPPPAFIEKLRNGHCDLFADVIALPLPGEACCRVFNETSRQQEQFAEQADALRRLSRQLGADYLFMAGGVLQSQLETKPWAILDLAILPALCMPSQKLYVEAQASGVLIDAHTGQILTFVNVDISDSRWSPTAFIDQREDALALAQKVPLSEALAEHFVQRLKTLHQERM